MLTYERTPNIKTTSYRLIEDGVEVLRNLTKKAAIFLINRLVTESVNESCQHLEQPIGVSEVQQTKESLNTGTTSLNCGEHSQNGESRISSLDVPQSTGSDLELVSTTNGELSSNNQSTTIQTTGVQSFIEELLTGDYSGITVPIQTIIGESRKIARLGEFALGIAQYCIENFNEPSQPNERRISQVGRRTIEPTTIDI